MKGSGCLKGCAIGCAVVAVLVIALMILGGVKVSQLMGSFDDAIATREQLEQELPTLESYQPPLDGRILPERMAVFIGVRQGLQAECARLSEVVGSLDGAVSEMSALEEKGEEPTFRELPWMAIGRTVGSAFSLAPAIGHFAKARNEALLEQRMGFGEYAWIFSAVYSQPVESDASSAQEGVEFDDVSERVRSALIAMMGRSLAAIDAEEQATAEIEAYAEALRLEIEALEDDPARTVWLEGAPGPLSSSIEPYASELEALACPSIREFELARNQKRGGMSITVD